MASSGDPGVFGEAGIGPEIRRVHDWVPEGMELQFAFMVHIRRDRYMFDAKYKKKYQGGFDCRLPMASNWSFRQFGEAFGPRMTGATSRGEPSHRNGISSQNSSVGPRRRGGSTSVGNSSRVPLEVEPDDYNSGVDEEKLYSVVIRNLRRAPRTENQDEAHNAVRVDDDAVGEDEVLAAVEWDPLNPHIEEGTVFASMNECGNALVTYCIKVELLGIVAEI
ncbi:hypothetical protein VPH35_068177 [Triticum aestivum]